MERISAVGELLGRCKELALARTLETVQVSAVRIADI
jgi:hypothetical protein